MTLLLMDPLEHSNSPQGDSSTASLEEKYLRSAFTSISQADIDLFLE